MVYTLEILKARHLEALGLRRPAPEEEEPADTAAERVRRDPRELLRLALPWVSDGGPR